MAYISIQCIECLEPTKRECGRYSGTDEKGKYSGTLYECDDVTCRIHMSYAKRKAALEAEKEAKREREQAYRKGTNNKRNKKIVR